MKVHLYMLELVHFHFGEGRSWRTSNIYIYRISTFSFTSFTTPHFDS